MELVTRAKDGWAKLRILTFQRDGGCVAVNPTIFGGDVAPDQCRDRNGWLIPWNDLFKMEWDHVREEAGGARVDDIAHGITVCPWHHRGDGWRSDSKAHRMMERLYLRSLYPEQWLEGSDATS